MLLENSFDFGSRNAPDIYGTICGADGDVLAVRRKSRPRPVAGDLKTVRAETHTRLLRFKHRKEQRKLAVNTSVRQHDPFVSDIH